MSTSWMSIWLIPPGANDRELTAIIARATADDPADRYPTAEALGDDIAAWRDGFPVQAVAGGKRYTFARFVDRHRSAVAAAVVALLLLVSALIVTLVARRAEAARFAELRSLANYMLFDLNAQLERVVGNNAARIGLVDRAQRYMSALAATPDAPPDLRLESARGFIALARIQSVPGRPHLSQPERARANLVRAIAMLASPELPVGDAKPLLADALSSLARIQANFDTDPKAAARSTMAADAALQAVPATERKAQWIAARSRLLQTRLELLVLEGKGEALLQAADRYEQEIDRWPAKLRDSRAAALDRAHAAHYRALGYYITNQLDKGVDAFRIAGRRFEALDRLVPNDPAVLYMLAYNGYTGYGAAEGLKTGQADADRFLRVARRTIDRLSAIDPEDVATRNLSLSVRGSEAQALANAGQFAAAMTLQREVVSLRRQLVGADRKALPLHKLALAQLILGSIAHQAGDRKTACENYDGANTVLAELEGAGGVLGSVGIYRDGLNFNARGCAAGAPLVKLRRLDDI